MDLDVALSFNLSSVLSSKFNFLCPSSGLVHLFFAITAFLRILFLLRSGCYNCISQDSFSFEIRMVIGEVIGYFFLRA